jgi:hypothetical protein
MKSLFAWLARAMGDGESPSCSRFLAVVCIPALLLVPLVVWTILSLVKGQMLDMPGSVTGFVLAATAPMLVFLNRQKNEETKQAQGGGA